MTVLLLDGLPLATSGYPFCVMIAAHFVCCFGRVGNGWWKADIHTSRGQYAANVAVISVSRHALGHMGGAVVHVEAVQMVLEIVPGLELTIPAFVPLSSHQISILIRLRKFDK